MKLGSDAEALAPDQPWAAIRSIGNVLRHEYDDVDPSVIWQTVERDLEPLMRSVQKALTRLSAE